MKVSASPWTNAAVGDGDLDGWMDTSSKVKVKEQNLALSRQDRESTGWPLLIYAICIYYILRFYNHRLH
jgi:hypothetical protein